MSPTPLSFFLAAAPGLEPLVAAEAQSLGLHVSRVRKGGVEATGDWPDLWRANIHSRGASRVLLRLVEGPTPQLSDLDALAGTAGVSDILPQRAAVRVEATCRKSKIFHSGAAAERVLNGITRGTALRAAEAEDEGAFTLMVRIDHDVATISVDTSGALLHRRGFKSAVGKAPIRETMAAMLLRACDYKPGDALVDPFCGSGTFLIEAAEMSLGLLPGRARPFAFETFRTADPHAISALRQQPDPPPGAVDPAIHGTDKDKAAITAARQNAERAGVAASIRLQHRPVATLVPPPGLAPGLVLTNPPYGARLGTADTLLSLYRLFGARLRTYFPGWRAGIVTSDPRLAEATGLPFTDVGPPIAHGPLRVRLYRTDPL